MIFDFIFPKSPLVSAVEKMSPEEFLNHTRLCTYEDYFPFPIFSIFSYKNPLVRLAIHEIKYKKNKIICALLAEIISQSIKDQLEDEVTFYHFIDPIIVPIPSHKNKFRLKGFNQTYFILKELAKYSVFDIEDVLIKTKKTVPQTKKNRAERLKLSNCFEVKTECVEIIRNRNIIIFDDVVTTGGTLIDARRALKNCGARRVVGFTIAH